jgi:hypothetical protein
MQEGEQLGEIVRGTVDSACMENGLSQAAIVGDA